jgi:hypothetical protein
MTVATTTMDQMEHEINFTPASNVGVYGQPAAASSYGASPDVPIVAALAVPYPEKEGTTVVEERTTVEVIAPSDLMGGYQFNVNTGDKSLLVAVVST